MGLLPVLALATAVLVADGLRVDARQARPEILVSAASSLAIVLSPIAAEYERAGGETVRLNLAASSSLARQILAGAPADLFISADEAQMDVVAGAGRLEPGTRTPLLSNQLVIVVPSDRPRVLKTAADLADPAIRRVAAGDPAVVPAGVYARQYLESLGLWRRIAPKIVPTGSVRAALAAVENGHVDAGFVFRTDALGAPRVLVALAVPVDRGPRIIYPAGVVKGGVNAVAARRFLEYLRGREARSVFERHGFIHCESRMADCGLRPDGAGTVEIRTERSNPPSAIRHPH